MLSSARFRSPLHTQSFLNSKIGMRLSFENRKMLVRACSVDLVLIEWTPHRKSTHGMKIEVGFGGSQRASAIADRPAAPPCPAGLVLVVSVALEERGSRPIIFRTPDFLPAEVNSIPAFLRGCERLRRRRGSLKSSWKFIGSVVYFPEWAQRKTYFSSVLNNFWSWTIRDLCPVPTRGGGGGSSNPSSCLQNNK